MLNKMLKFGGVIMTVNWRIVDVQGVQNAEHEISRVIGEEEYSRLTKVTYDKEKGKLTLDFEDDFTRKVNSFVKQVSKKKYKSINEFYTNEWQQFRKASLVAVIELPKMWLMFFNKD